jgi:hypothetical protein
MKSMFYLHQPKSAYWQRTHSGPPGRISAAGQAHSLRRKGQCRHRIAQARRRKIPLTVVALLEYRSKGISPEIRQQAVNRLAAVPEFRGDEVQAVQRIADEAFGQTVH